MWIHDLTIMHPQPHLLFIILHHHSSSYFLLHPLLIYSLLLFFRATLSSSFSLLDYLNCSKRAASVRRSSPLAQLPVIWPCHFACDQSPNGLAYLKGVERKSSERAWTLHVGSWSINLCMEHVGLNQDKWPEFRAGETWTFALRCTKLMQGWLMKIYVNRRAVSNM